MPTSPRNLVLGASLLLLFGAFLPWVTITSPFLGLSQSLTGIDGDGIFSAAGGIILLIIAMTAKGSPGKNYSVPGVIISILCALLLFGKFSTVNDLKDSDNSAIISTGIGLYLSLLGSILGTIGSFIKLPEEASIQSKNIDQPASTEIPTQPKKN